MNMEIPKRDGQKSSRALCIVVVLVTVIALLAGDGLAVTEGSSGFPEGSGSVIQPLTWHVTGKPDQQLRGAVREVIGNLKGSGFLREEHDFFAVTLPSEGLEALTAALEQTGIVVQSPRKGSHPAPTTLLRIVFPPHTP